MPCTNLLATAEGGTSNGNEVATRAGCSRFPAFDAAEGRGDVRGMLRLPKIRLSQGLTGFRMTDERCLFAVRAFEFEDHEFALATAAGNPVSKSPEEQGVPFTDTLQHDLMRVWHMGGVHCCHVPFRNLRPRMAQTIGHRLLHNLIPARCAQVVKGHRTPACARRMDAVV